MTRRAKSPGGGGGKLIDAVDRFDPDFLVPGETLCPEAALDVVIEAYGFAGLARRVAHGVREMTFEFAPTQPGSNAAKAIDFVRAAIAAYAAKLDEAADALDRSGIESIDEGNGVPVAPEDGRTA